jgi:hypothetical protein
MVMDLRMGDVLRLRRKHPCGGFEWQVVRVGADVGLICRTCGRRVLLDRPTLHRRVQAVVERGAPLDPAIERALFGADEAGGAGAASGDPDASG